MIRPLRLDDADEAAALIRAAFATLALAIDPAPSGMRVQGDGIVAHLEAGGGGAMHGRDGCVLWRPDEGAWYLSRLAVLPRARGRGVASALLAHAESVARQRGVACLRLEVRLALEGNRRLFRRIGFVEGARHSHPGYTSPTYVTAEKRL